MDDDSDTELSCAYERLRSVQPIRSRDDDVHGTEAIRINFPCGSNSPKYGERAGHARGCAGVTAKRTLDLERLFEILYPSFGVKERHR